MAETVSEYDPNIRGNYTRVKKDENDVEDATFKAKAGGMEAGSGLGRQDKSFADDPQPGINDKGIDGDAVKLATATVQWRKRRKAKQDAGAGTVLGGALKKALTDSSTIKVIAAGGK